MNKDFKNILWDLSNSLRGIYFSKDFIFILIRLVFLKYCIDNSIGADSKEDMQACLNAQKAISKRDPEILLNSTIPVLKYLDEAYGLNSVLSSTYNVGEYAEVFGVDVSKQRKSVSAESYKSAIDTLAGFDFDETVEGSPVGRNLAEALISLFYEYNQRSYMAKESSTSSIIGSIAGRILDVKQGEVFCDFCAGIGLSTIAITGDSLAEIKTIDNDPTVAPIAAMLYIMYGYKNISILSGDSLTGDMEIPKADKVFVDAPLGLRLPYGDAGTKWDCSSIAADIALNRCLKDDGVAVITAPGSMLFQSNSAAQTFKEFLVLGSYIKAIIAFPPLWQGTNVGTNLLVLSKRPNNPLLINVVGERAKKGFSEATAIIGQETIDKVVDFINHPRDEKGFARIVTANDIFEKGCNLIPALYIEQDIEEDTTTVAEIDNKLNELYKQLLG